MKAASTVGKGVEGKKYHYHIKAKAGQGQARPVKYMVIRWYKGVSCRQIAMAVQLQVQRRTSAMFSNFSQVATGFKPEPGIPEEEVDGHV